VLQKTFRLLPVSLNREKGFTLVEVIFVVLITGFIITALFYAMNAAQLSYTLNSTRADLQAEVRRTMDWIVRDVHQAVSWEIANNSPSPSYIKFRQVTGWDTVNKTFLLSNNYIEYIYYPDSSTIIRRKSDLNNNTIGTWTLNYVTASPFFTINSSGAIVPLNNNDLLTSKQLVITISGQKQVIGAQNTTYTLTEEVQIRNG